MASSALARAQEENLRYVAITWARLELVLVKAEGFESQPGGGVLMDATTRKTFLTALTQRKRDEVVHPLLGDKVSIGLLPHIQARLLARHLRGDLADYPALILK